MVPAKKVSFFARAAGELAAAPIIPPTRRVSFSNRASAWGEVPAPPLIVGMLALPEQYSPPAADSWYSAIMIPLPRFAL